MFGRKSHQLLLLGLIWGIIVGAGPLAQAMPPHLDLVASDNPLLKRNLARYDSLRLSAGARGINQPNRLALSSAFTGSRRLLVIPVRFSDHDSSVASQYFDSLLFGHTTQTVWDYYNEVSYGTFSVDAVDLPSEIGWQLAPTTYAYYTNGNYGTGVWPNNSQKLVEDLIDQIDSAVDFGDYDADNDGYVDGVVIIHAGTGAEISGSPDDMWSHMWSIWPPQTRDGKTIMSYSIQPEFWSIPGDMTIGVYCHELGHLLLGLPDLYDYDDPPNDSYGLGLWSLMAAGSWGGPMYKGNYPAHLDAWCRTQTGWVIPTVIDSAQDDYSIPAIENSPVIIKLWTDGETIGDEYFLVENRQKTGYDSYLPGSGLCVYHVDGAVTTGNDNEWYPGHTGSGHYHVALEQADGNWDLEKGYNPGSSGDPYPGWTGNRLFTAASTPSSDAYDGTPTYVIVADISNSGPVMTADFHVSLGSGIVTEEESSVPSAFSLGRNYPNPFNPSTSFEYSLPADGPVTVEVFNVLGQKVHTLWSGFRDGGTHTASWDGTDELDRCVSAGLYFYRVSAIGQVKNSKMILLK